MTTRTLTIVAVWALTALPASAQLEDFRTRQLMQDVAELKRVVGQQSRRIEELERQVAQGSSKSGSRAAPSRASEGRGAEAAKAPWLSLANWDRVQTGMSEKQVLEILGYPTSSRSKDSSPAKILFYTMPVASSAFLSGNIELENDRVRSVQRPVLR